MPRLEVLRLAVPAEPLRLCQRLRAAGLPEVALLHAGSEGGWGRASWLTAAPDAESTALDPVTDDDLGPLEGPLAAAPRWWGTIPYEARRAALERPAYVPADPRPTPRFAREPRWYRYRAAAHVAPQQAEVRLVGDDPAALARLRRALEDTADPSPLGARYTVSAEPPDEHRARIAAARELILDGDLYQVNLARRLAIALTSGDAWSLYEQLATRAPAPFGAVLPLGDGATVLSLSPELLLEATPRGSASSAGGDWPGFGRLVTEPIKGTRPRGTTPEEDDRLAAELDADAKERAELAMIVDVERNDLGAVCDFGTVRVALPPTVRRLPRVHHRLARVVGEARGDATRREVLEALVPSGSVSGAPKRRAMEVIATLEADRRGLYTGGLGYVSHDGGLRLAMAIRCAVMGPDGRGEYFTGGGIVAGSDPDREVAETGWKARPLVE
ncbi:MAG: anthranilate synthase component I family protein [Polyangiaceae bacterium]